MDDAFRVSYDPQPTTNWVADLSKRLRRTLVRYLISAVVFTALYIWQRHSLPGWGGAVLLLVGWVPALGLIGWNIVQLRAARRSLASLGSGEALVVSRAGIEGFTPGHESERMPWAEIASVSGANGRFGQGPELVVTRHDGRRWSVPLDQLDAQAGTIDNAVRVYSSGRIGLDLSDLAL